METQKKLENKKILYIITQTKWGGAQKYVIELAEYFAKKNEVHIAYGEASKTNQQFIDHCHKLNIKTIALKYLAREIDLGNEFLASKELSQLLNRGNYNIIHLNSSKAGAIGSLAAMFYNFNPLNVKARIIYTAHGYVFNEPLNKLVRRAYIMSETFSAGIQNRIIAVSEYDKKTALENKICSEHKIRVIRNGLDFRQYNFLEKDKAKQILKLDPNYKYFGTIASFYKTKGYNYLAEAIKMLKDDNNPLLAKHRFVFIGDGPELLDIKKYLNENNLNDLIKIIRPNDNDWQYLKAFDYFVLASVKEGLPFTILEAGLAGIPTIATEVGGIPEILEKEKTGLLITPANPLSLKNSIIELSNNNHLAQNIASKNYQNIKENFSLEKTLNETEKLYSELF